MSLHTSLLVCPKNLKECIDWVLRATERDKTGTNNNIDNLKKALEAELPDFINNSIDLTQLVHGLCLFLGYPSCLCSLKANVDKSLQDISRKLIQDSEAVKSCVSKTLTLNCSNCESKNILCKCCVISCIKELREKCPCLSNPSQSCQCKDPKGKCCKDFLSGLEACLSLLNLKTDLEDCKCKPEDNCCKTGTCTSGCNVCDPQKFPDNAMTGLGICPMNPRKLAEKLEKFFGDRSSKGSSVCYCQCGTPGSSQNKSCCCLACPDTAKCSSKKSCFCGSTSQCSCASKLQLPKDSPCKTFCSKIKDVKVLVRSKEMTCCNQGKDCHCKLDSNCSTSGQNCCVEKDTYGSDVQHSVKCMLRRVVKFFASFDPSKPDCPKLCCEIFCVLKCCVFLRDFYNRGNKEKCGTCKPGGSNCNGSTLANKGSSNLNCCNGTAGCKSGNCLGCIGCSAIKFRNAFNELRLAGPCGLDLYRLLDDLLNFCSNVMHPNQNFIRSTAAEAVNSCPNCKKSGTDSKSWSDCKCSSSSSPCEACPKLLNDSKLMFILRHGYSSAYSEASWPSLTSSTSGSKCCSLPSCSCPPSGCSSSCPSNCCDACPQRKAAKIFLGMLPCLYYGLKILYDRCQYGSDFPTWNLGHISQGSIGSFLSAWGYRDFLNPSIQAVVLPGLLENIFTFKVLENLSTLVTEKYFTSHLISSGSSVPSTVRSMLLWLYGLPFTSGFHDLVLHCKSLCSPFGNSFNPDAFCYYIHTCCFILPVSFISTVQHSDSHVSTFFSDAHSEILKFSYPSDPSALADMLFDLVRKIYIPLHFLRFQCSLESARAGWQDCAYGQGCAQALQEDISKSPPATSSSGSPSCSCPGHDKYLCTTIIGQKNHAEHCIKPGQTCMGLKECTDDGKGQTKTGGPGAHTSDTCNPYPHPLVRFLVDGSSENLKNLESLFKLPEHSFIPKMGFSKDHLPSPGRKGRDLYDVLNLLCYSGYYPLTRLLQFVLGVSRHPPESLGELFAFFMRFTESSLLKDFESYISEEPGRPDGKALTNAMKDFYGSHSGSSHSNDLKSLYDCAGGSSSTCGKYLYSLTYNAYHGFIEGFLGTYLSWVCHLAPTFEKKLKEFHHEASTKFQSCCSSGKCEKIVHCPCSLPFIYKYGFQFNSPQSLNVTNKKSCQNFVTQLGLVADGHLFKNLLRVIDEFIWHIRLPFIYAFLYIWILVISYFYYVQFYKLDLLHIDSHLHLPRSFKILPSTLFSDASSKLKDLSYFTL